MVAQSDALTAATLDPARAYLSERLRGTLVRLTYLGEITYEPILSHVMAASAAKITILQGEVSSIKDVPFGQLLLELEGSADGVEGAIPPLVVGTAPFFARLVENVLREVDRGVIEACQAMGIRTHRIIFGALLREALPGLIAAVTVTAITLTSYAAMSGVIGGGGGLGDEEARGGAEFGRGEAVHRRQVQGRARWCRRSDPARRRNEGLPSRVRGPQAFFLGVRASAGRGTEPSSRCACMFASGALRGAPLEGYLGAAESRAAALRARRVRRTSSGGRRSGAGAVAGRARAGRRRGRGAAARSRC